MFALTDVLKFKITAVISLVLLAVILGMFAYFKVQTTALENTISDQRTKIGALEVEVSTLTAANKAMEASVKEQNAKVDALLKDFRVASEFADKAIAKARADAGVWQEKYRKALTAPTATSDECADLSSKVNAYLSLRIDGGL